jgi:hypothetical protein
LRSCSGSALYFAISEVIKNTRNHYSHMNTAILLYQPNISPERHTPEREIDNRCRVFH